MTDGKVRLDKWLWAARFFKTRALAVESIEGGKVNVNGERVKRAKLVQPGDRVDIRLPHHAHRVVVRAVAERRVTAAAAALLYEETAESVAGRERVAFQLKAAHVLFVPETNERPTKRDRRRLEQFKKDTGWEG